MPQGLRFAFVPRTDTGEEEKQKDGEEERNMEIIEEMCGRFNCRK